MDRTSETDWEEIKALFRETDRKFQETDRKFQETREFLDGLSRRFGELGNRLGEFVETMVEPAVVRLFQDRGLAVREVHRRVTADRNGERIEIDLLVVDGDAAVAVECKSRITIRDVERHLDRLNRIKRLMPRFSDARIHGALAGMVIDDEAADFAERLGFWVLAPSGETMTLRNGQDFAPRVW